MVFTIPRRSSANPVTILFTSSSYGLSRTASLDRKSTRLNSSHSQISYAVFCLKKNKRFEIHEREDVCDALERARRLRAHSDDACVRVRAAHERCVKHTVTRPVVDTAPAPAALA